MSSLIFFNSIKTFFKALKAQFHYTTLGQRSSLYYYVLCLLPINISLLTKVYMSLPHYTRDIYEAQAKEPPLPSLYIFLCMSFKKNEARAP